MSPVLEVLDAQGIARRRAELLQTAGMSEDRLRKQADAFKLDQEKQAILREIEELEFLSGE